MEQWFGDIIEEHTCFLEHSTGGRKNLILNYALILFSKWQNWRTSYNWNGLWCLRINRLQDGSSFDIEPDYPRDMHIWEGVPYNIDSVLRWKDGNIYFFKGKVFWKFDDKHMRVASSTPTLSAPFWMGCTSSPIIPTEDPTTNSPTSAGSLPANKINLSIILSTLSLIVILHNLSNVLLLYHRRTRPTLTANANICRIWHVPYLYCDHQTLKPSCRFQSTPTCYFKIYPFINLAC